MTEALKRSLERSRRSDGTVVGRGEEGGRRLRDERGPSVVCGRSVLARARIHGVKGVQGGREGERAPPPHTYTSDNKKGSIRRWVGGNINRGGETVLEGERQAGPGEVAV